MQDAIDLVVGHGGVAEAGSESVVLAHQLGLVAGEPGDGRGIHLVGRQPVAPAKDLAPQLRRDLLACACEQLAGAAELVAVGEARHDARAQRLDAVERLGGTGALGLPGRLVGGDLEWLEVALEGRGQSAGGSGARGSVGVASRHPVIVPRARAARRSRHRRAIAVSCVPGEKDADDRTHRSTADRGRRPRRGGDDLRAHPRRRGGARGQERVPGGAAHRDGAGRERDRAARARRHRPRGDGARRARRGPLRRRRRDPRLRSSSTPACAASASLPPAKASRRISKAAPASAPASWCRRWSRGRGSGR